MQRKKQKNLSEQINSGWVRVREYVNRWGKKMVASDYGYEFWTFFVKNKRS